ncbi:hypothetical protein [Denitrobaculum tricleocarpae]|uniref:Anti-sigma factor n=1 Tax=Denitrobaculum tricleocarpae TaxID=2591009 RepID=A0A545U104_9PROT|nr:hypothetical protein [Denitrobaculum tricleocarpae]TQV83124.1 hypothetical protein FKG95_00535 [Denitrobaculum tricleocarpae]
MVKLNDETLIAYSDGELDEKTAAEVEAALKDDPVAREIVHKFQEAARLAGEAFDDPMQEEVPERLLKLFEEPRSEEAAPEAPGAPAAESSNIADLSQIRAARETKRHTNVTAIEEPGTVRRFALPLAASLALIIGIGGGFGLSNFTAPSAPDVIAAGTIPQSSVLHAALERSPSLQSLEEVSGDGLTKNQIEPLLSFVDNNDRHCREYRITSSNVSGSQDLTGVACRGDDGAWTQQIAVVQEIPASGGYSPASGQTDSVLESFLNGIMKDEPLDDEAEARLLDSGWQ